jgi:hypothetical protein
MNPSYQLPTVSDFMDEFDMNDPLTAGLDEIARRLDELEIRISKEKLLWNELQNQKYKGGMIF